MKKVFRCIAMILLSVTLVGCAGEASKKTEDEEYTKMHTFNIVFDENNTADLRIYNMDGKKQGGISMYFDGQNPILEVTRMYALELLFSNIKVEDFSVDIRTNGKDSEPVYSKSIDSKETLIYLKSPVHEPILENSDIISFSEVTDELKFITNQIIKNITDE